MCVCTIISVCVCVYNHECVYIQSCVCLSENTLRKLVLSFYLMERTISYPLECPIHMGYCIVCLLPQHWGSRDRQTSEAYRSISPVHLENSSPVSKAKGPWLPRNEIISIASTSNTHACGSIHTSIKHSFTSHAPSKRASVGEGQDLLRIP